MRRRRKTTTSKFGAGARESHDATPFYERFRPPELSSDDDVPPPTPIGEPFVHGDARCMDRIPDGSVALVVTSPPYFAGKQYEQELEREGVPSSYLEYLAMLTDVFAECVRKLEPGGRIAVNVANLGRKPYRSLSADVIRILEHDLGLLLRGELIWQKGGGRQRLVRVGLVPQRREPGAARHQRARDRRQQGPLRSSACASSSAPPTACRTSSTLTTEDFMALTLDIWSIPAESARRVGHPAPFPVELPEQLIRLYTFEDDLVLDPFMGSGSALVAAARLGRRYVGYDLDASYVELARRRVEEAVRPEPTPALRSVASEGRAARDSPTRGAARRRLRGRGTEPPDPRHRRHGVVRGHRCRGRLVAVRRGRCVHQSPRRAAADRRRVALPRQGLRPARRTRRRSAGGAHHAPAAPA